MLKGVAERAGLLDKDDNDIADDEDCGNCELVKTCNLNAAVKYRKEHGIPRPKKGKVRKVDVN
jgi:hypothetical protein